MAAQRLSGVPGACRQSGPRSGVAARALITSCLTVLRCFATSASLTSAKPTGAPKRLIPVSTNPGGRPSRRSRWESATSSRCHSNWPDSRRILVLPSASSMSVHDAWSTKRSVVSVGETSGGCLPTASGRCSGAEMNPTCISPISLATKRLSSACGLTPMTARQFL